MHHRIICAVLENRLEHSREHGRGEKACDRASKQQCVASYPPSPVIASLEEQFEQGSHEQRACPQDCEDREEVDVHAHRGEKWNDPYGASPFAVASISQQQPCNDRQDQRCRRCGTEGEVGQCDTGGQCCGDDGRQQAVILFFLSPGPLTRILD